MKKAQGGAAASPGAGLEPHHAAQVQGLAPNEVPMTEVQSPPDHVIHIEDHDSFKDEGLAQRVINKLDFQHEESSEGELPTQTSGENLVTFVSDLKVPNDWDAPDENGNEEENSDDT